jgi:2-amino-4-hydroxy-6-hydroxymethyldihydropteridine diphosphokinase
MKTTKRVYISLGSNKGDKFQNLQAAINSLYQKIGNIKIISKVYKSRSFGFEGEDFLNICAIVETNLRPNKVLQELLKIEKSLGRIRARSKNYEDRIIDLDILFYEDEIIKSKSLKVPHPEMQKRKFVLVPLNDIASNYIHPINKKTVMDILEECEDDSILESTNIWLKNPNKKYKFSNCNYIAIEGNIGAGKTSLATKMATDFNAKLILERFADNPFLPKFYEDPQRYAFPLEMSFLADRYQQISDDLSQLDLFKDFIVSDYDVFKSLIFSKITLQEDEFKLYRKLFYLMYKDIAKPDIYVYLYQNTERLKYNIKQRGRKYEQNIDSDYLEKINTGYLEFLRSQTEIKSIVIDISDRDFVKNREDYLNIVDEMASLFDNLSN